MSHIKTFARLKPAGELYEDYEIHSRKTFSVKVPELLRDYGTPSAQNRCPTISYDFQFDRVFDTPTHQEEVYNVAARDIVTGFLDGYNGTIFAYGQTGTGKTYTVEGSPLRYSDRGLAPRALTEVYKSLEQRENEDITLSISYLEIYQEVAYDLLSTTARTASPVTVFPRVTVVEGTNGTCAVRNLSVHLAPSEDVASALLLQGQANRKVAETPVNQRSSRSHAVFTIYLEAKKHKSDLITRSKLHLVDLAGSERVAKTGVDGQQLTEAKSINLSLHYLESVIIALQADSSHTRPRSTHSSNSKGNISLGGRPTSSEATRRHVPYRNSLLTMVLRDSLGGNCQTSMIATISLEVQNLGETLSTCRFAQRVACIANHARRNEEIDDKTLIQQLKRRVAELETQMACLKMSLHAEENGERGRRGEEEDMSSKLTDEDKLSCAQVVQEYLAGRVSDPLTAGITNPFKFRECLRILKKMIMSKYFQEKLVPSQATPSSADEAEAPRAAANQALGSVASKTSLGAGGRGGKATEASKHVQILEGEKTEESNRGTAVQPMGNGVMDTDDLILNIQRLYAATRKEQQARQQAVNQQAATSDHPGTPPKLMGARPDTYKSPYERKREKEIRKLSRRLETMKQTQSEQEQQLQELRTSTAFGELTSMEIIVKNKIQVTREQIADQHAYLLHLRHTEAGQEILQQEKLVEDQLIKREAKFQKKLDEVQQKKAEMEAQVTQGHGSEDKDTSEGQGQGKMSAGKRSLEDQFSQYKKRNGTLNTRQVFDMLKSEERKQSKANHQTETEKRFLMTKHLAMKEEATRERLRELKEMMRKSREQALLGQGSYPPDIPFGGFGGGGGGGGAGNPSAPLFGAWTDQPVTEGEEALNQTFVVEETDNSYTNKDADNGGGPHDEGGRLPARSGVFKSGPSGAQQHTPHSQPHSQPLTRPDPSPHSQPLTRPDPSPHSQPPTRPDPSPHSGSRADLKWESAYSRPCSSHSVRSHQSVSDTPPPPQKNTVPPSSRVNGGVLNSLAAVPSADLVRGERNEGASSGSEWSAENVSSSTELRLSSLEGRVEGGDRSQDSGEGWTGTATTAVGKRDKTGPHGDKNNASTYNHTEEVGLVFSEDIDDLKASSPVAMPSEYVHRMDSKDKFDARKMGLSAKTFDSALSSMLSDDTATKPVSYGFQFYDQYARESKPPRRKETSSRNAERSVVASSAHQGSERSRTTAADLPKDHSGTAGSAWGPEVKNSSVAIRLAQFLSDDKSSRHRPRTETTASTRTTKSVSFLERLNQLQEEEKGTPADAEARVSSPRIQALQDAQRESTYMGRIQAEKERVAKIRQAREAAEAIQRAWRRHCQSGK